MKKKNNMRNCSHISCIYFKHSLASVATKIKSVIINNHEMLEIFIGEQLSLTKIASLFFLLSDLLKAAVRHTLAHFILAWFSLLQLLHWNAQKENNFWIINCLKCNYFILCAMEFFCFFLSLSFACAFSICVSLQIKKIKESHFFSGERERMLHIYLCIALVQQVILIWHDVFNEHTEKKPANASDIMTLRCENTTNWMKNRNTNNNNKTTTQS